MNTFAKYLMCAFYGVFVYALGFEAWTFEGFIVTSFGAAVICEVYRLCEHKKAPN